MGLAIATRSSSNGSPIGVTSVRSLVAACVDAGTRRSHRDRRFVQPASLAFVLATFLRAARECAALEAYPIVLALGDVVTKIDRAPAVMVLVTKDGSAGDIVFEEEDGTVMTWTCVWHTSRVTSG